ncbi:hypothetical protein OHAE_3425 [Ochrobactrum soli]|uniref:Uncharacterized protein n=1 Tax=Ochrobactrum soli TaxID=2448455 RepID=A0A2P9HHH6_9HYPH|nr:hypothetical protein OHAE_3425 [[Ochrobactrum] soli]
MFQARFFVPARIRFPDRIFCEFYHRDAVDKVPQALSDEADIAR